MSKSIIIFIILLQLLIIIYLIYTTYIKYISPSVSVNPLQKNTLTFSPTDTLRYFFEPKANITITEPNYKLVNLDTAPHYRINNDTLNERFNYTVKKPDNTFRIITLGDSFTYGMYMNTNENWSEVLEETLQSCNSLTQFEVINLAVPNYDIQYSIERFKKRGMKYNPDLVIWFLKNDDFAQINEITLPKKMKYYEDINKNGTLENNTKNGKYWLHTEKAIKEFEEKYTKKQILTVQQEILQSFNKYYINNLLLVSQNTTYTNNKFIIEDFARKRKNSFTHVALPEFSELPDHHPSSQGHKQIAENIYKYLVNKQIISCNQ